MKQLPDGCIDLIYIDPPFNSNRNYDVLSELRRWRKWLDAINHNKAIAAAGGGTPLRLHRPTLECYLRYVDALPQSMRGVRPQIVKAIEELLREAQVN